VHFRITEHHLAWNKRVAKMTRTIEALRKAAEEYEQRAKLSSDRNVQAELYDLAARWHWLAGQVGEVCEKSEELETA
jgi:hypothetical protein